ncbi:MAG: T3/T7 RNA polymerase [Pseudomonadota bacterium]|nr:T3/T7 RNA polymerase [Pseudomonadota bacterium]
MTANSNHLETFEQRLVRQLELEKEMIGLGQERYFKQMSREDEANMPPGQLLVRQSVAAVAAGIEEWAEAVLSGTSARRGGATVREVKEAGYTETAIIALRTCIGNIKQGTKYQTVAFEIAAALEKMLEYKDFQKQAPMQLKWAERDIAHKGNGKQRERALDYKRMDAGVQERGWTEEFRLNVGVRLLEIVIETTGFFEKDLVRTGPKVTQAYLKATASLLQWLNKQHQTCSLLSPFSLPMLIPPREWTTPYNGGYHSVHNTLLKTSDKAHLRTLAGMGEQLSRVYSATNGLQNTKWRINKKVYDVMSALWELGGDRAKMPPRDGKLFPDRPDAVDHDSELLKSYKNAMREVYDYNHRITGKVSDISTKLWIAEKFLDEQEFYFPYTLDWRGRAYPISTGLSPQGDDSSKALLEFAEGIPLGEEGAAWLFVHVANSWGFDKAGYEARIQWVKEHSQELLDYAIDPLANQGWTKAADPFLFLAACFDYLGWHVHGPEHVSHLPIQVDGTCNGLQNYSAMLRDSVGGAATNLVPSEKPSDIYQQVADRANLLIWADKEEGVEEALQLPSGFVTRKLAKRNTMTVPYAVTLFGMRDQLIDEMKKMKADGVLPDIGELTIPQVANYVAKINYQAIGSTVVAARQAMDWLQDAVKVSAACSDVIEWTTPVGLLVKQAYMKKESKQIKVLIKGKASYFLIGTPGSKPNTRKQVVGIAPNFIHSCDASHMMLTINAGLAAGIEAFSFIHDSFGTHAANMMELSILLREQFVEQYSGDVLGEFRKGLLETITESEVAAYVPECPPMGTLELEEIKESLYFFA